MHLSIIRWYHGPISREDAERLLTSQNNGTFLIRDSQSFPGDYTLSVGLVKVYVGPMHGKAVCMITTQPIVASTNVWKTIALPRMLLER